MKKDRVWAWRQREGLGGRPALESVHSAGSVLYISPGLVREIDKIKSSATGPLLLLSFVCGKGRYSFRCFSHDLREQALARNLAAENLAPNFLGCSLAPQRSTSNSGGLSEQVLHTRRYGPTI